MFFFNKKPYSVKLRGQSTVIYSEGDKTIRLFYEMTGGDEIVMHVNELIKWAPPYDSILLTDDEISKIQNNISEGLQRHQIPVRWS